MADKPTSPPPAYFLSLSLENVRSFGEKQTISFATKEGRPAQWTIILGDNGVGKTTVLRCAAYFMTEETPLLSSSTKGKEIFFSANLTKAIFPIRKDGRNMASILCDLAVGKSLSAARKTIDDAPFIQIFPSVVTKGQLDVGMNLNPNSLRGLVCYGYGAGRTMRWSGESGENWVLTSQTHGKSPSHETAAL